MMEREEKLARLRLIAITDPQLPGGWPATAASAGEALAAGLPALMLRDKYVADAELEPIARRLQARAEACGALMIVNRRLALARAMAAAGVHLGAHGPTVAEARAVLGDAVLIGYSAHTPEEALGALAKGADYVTFSPIFATPSKEGILAPLGLGPLAELARLAPGRVVALGGIDENNIDAVMQTGVAGVAVIRAILGQPDPARATRQLMRRLPPAE